MTDQLTKVIVFGTFDFFHAGHEYFLKKAKSLGNYLIVVVALDSTVKRIKGELPENNEKERLKIIKKQSVVDKAILGEVEDKYAVIKKYRPDIIALGYDQFVFTYKIKPTIIKSNIDAKIIRLDAFKPETFKSSIIKQKYVN